MLRAAFSIDGRLPTVRNHKRSWSELADVSQARIAAVEVRSLHVAPGISLRSLLAPGTAPAAETAPRLDHRYRQGVPTMAGCQTGSRPGCWRDIVRAQPTRPSQP